MGYRWRDIIVLYLARITGAKVATVHMVLEKMGWR